MIAALSILAIGVVPSTPAESSGAEQHLTVTFEVGNSATSQQIEGVGVLMLTRNGEFVTLGRTDALGRLQVPRETLVQQGSSVVLFYKERFFCGALRMDDPEFFKYEFHLIHLASFVVP